MKIKTIRNVIVAASLMLEALCFTSPKMPPSYHRVSRRPISTQTTRAALSQPGAVRLMAFESAATSESGWGPFQDVFSSEDESTTVLDSIDQEIYEREDAIDRFAEEMARRYGCPPSTIEVQDLLYSAAMAIENVLNPAVSSNDLQLELSSIMDDQLTIDNSNGSIASQLASARYAEACVGVEKDELLDKYRDYSHSLEERDCRQAEDIAVELQDVVRQLEAIRTCYGTDEFYAKLRQLSEDDLALSARGLPKNEYDRWRKACDYLRRRQDIPNEQAFVSCLADIALGSLDYQAATPAQLGVTSRDMEELISFLSSSDIQRICALRTSVQQARYVRGRTVVDPETFFRECVDEGE